MVKLEGGGKSRSYKPRFGHAGLYRTNKGVSLVIAMILIPILMMLAVSLIEPIIGSYRAAAADQKRLLAKAIAQNIYEKALFETKDLPIGANAEGEFNEQSMEYGDKYGKFTATWSVLGQPETDEEHTINNEYYVPSIGTGDVGGDYCSSASPVYDEDTLIAALGDLSLLPDLIDDPASWPCNWGKLKEGESVTIPLYSEDGSGNVSNFGNNTFELRVRAACDPSKAGDREDTYIGEICGDGDAFRYQLVGEGEIPGDTVIAIWEITGQYKNETGKNIYLTGFKKSSMINSILTVNAINNYSTGHCSPNVLCVTSITKDQDGTFINPISFYLQDLYKPTLNLMVVHSLKVVDTDPPQKVPYLEYQFRTSASGTGTPPVSNSAKIVKVEVMVDGGYTETIEKTIGLQKPVTGFVIQQ